ncbi:MAG: hypothetical protein ACRDSN_11690 [Pseudonocardiaceae bacterium]
MGRSAFTQKEIETLRANLRELRPAERSRQKTIRARMRRTGFYITDFATDAQGFTVSDFDDLLRRGVIKMVD